MKQEQFLNLASAEEALKKFRDAVNPAPLGEEQILLKEARGHGLLSAESALLQEEQD